MVAHSHIKLIVPDPLDKTVARSWLETVRATLPSGLPGEAEIMRDGEPKTSNFYHAKSQGQDCYVVPLSRDPTVAEAQAVAIAWNKAAPEGDFEIDYSSAGSAAEVKKDVESIGMREIAMEAAKLNHNAWLTEMSQQGWSYGNQFNQRDKRNPMLMPWDQLSPKYRLREMSRFDKLMEVLDRMQLQLVRKRR